MKSTFFILCAASILSAASLQSSLCAEPNDQALSIVYGQIQEIIKPENIMVVMDDEKKQKLSISATEETTFWIDYDSVDITALQPNDYVEIEYREQDKALQANWVEIYRE